MHHREQNERYRKTPISGPPEPWLHLTTLHAGSVHAVGFTESEEYLLVISVSGRGLFELPSGARVARDYDEDGDWWDVSHLRAKALAPVADEWVRVAGIHGGGLLYVTDDGWSLELVAPDWPSSVVFLYPPQVGVSRTGFNLGPDRDESIRVYGFSASGRYFVIATGSEVLLFGRGPVARRALSPSAPG